MAITSDRVREIFKGLEDGGGASFFQHVADDVDWIVMGTHPLAGHYLNKTAFIDGTFAKLAKVLPKGAQLHTENVIVQDDQAAVELHSLATAKNGMRFDNRYWVVYFREGLIVCEFVPTSTQRWSRACSRRIQLHDPLPKVSICAASNSL